MKTTITLADENAAGLVWAIEPVNRGHWHDLQVGDRVVVRLFFAGENR